MARDVPVIPLWQEPVLAAFRSRLRGFVPTEPLVAWNAEEWWLDDSVDGSHPRAAGWVDP